MTYIVRKIGRGIYNLQSKEKIVHVHRKGDTFSADEGQPIWLTKQSWSLVGKWQARHVKRSNQHLLGSLFVSAVIVLAYAYHVFFIGV